MESTPSLEPLTPSEEHTWAMIAHLSILLNLVTGLLGLVGAFIVIWSIRIAPATWRTTHFSPSSSRQSSGWAVAF
jgi:uncharacterized Tic20 family protein